MASVAQQFQADALFRRGSCLCRRVQYSVHGSPTRRQLCHCNNCQKTSGSSFGANIVYKKEVRAAPAREAVSDAVRVHLIRNAGNRRPLYGPRPPGQVALPQAGDGQSLTVTLTPKQFEILAGDDSIRTYHDGDTRSGAILYCAFCSNCGSTLFLTNSLVPTPANNVVVTSGTLDGEKDFWPERELNCETRFPFLEDVRGTEKVGG